MTAASRGVSKSPRVRPEQDVPAERPSHAQDMEPAACRRVCAFLPGEVVSLMVVAAILDGPKRIVHCQHQESVHLQEGGACHAVETDSVWKMVRAAVILGTVVLIVRMSLTTTFTVSVLQVSIRRRLSLAYARITVSAVLMEVASAPVVGVAVRAT